MRRCVNKDAGPKEVDYDVLRWLGVDLGRYSDINKILFNIIKRIEETILSITGKSKP